MKVSLYTTIGLTLSGIVLGCMYGYSLTPDYRNTMYTSTTMDLGPADRTFDLRYINAMIAHHNGALLLAEQLAQTTTRPELRSLAQAIQEEEPKAIQELYGWKKAWYKDTRTVRTPVVAQLGTSDEKSDLRFLNAMIAHHEEGVRMTKEAHQKSSRSEILNNADAVESFLKKSIETLTGLRSSWYPL